MHLSLTLYALRLHLPTLGAYHMQHYQSSHAFNGYLRDPRHAFRDVKPNPKLVLAVWTESESVDSSREQGYHPSPTVHAATAISQASFLAAVCQYALATETPKLSSSQKCLSFGAWMQVAPPNRATKTALPSRSHVVD